MFHNVQVISVEIVGWEPEGRYRNRLFTAIVPFWFSTDEMSVHSGVSLTLKEIRKDIVVIS